MRSPDLDDSSPTDFPSFAIDHWDTIAGASRSSTIPTAVTAAGTHSGAGAGTGAAGTSSSPLHKSVSGPLPSLSGDYTQFSMRHVSSSNNNSIASSGQSGALQYSFGEVLRSGDHGAGSTGKMDIMGDDLNIFEEGLAPLSRTVRSSRDPQPSSGSGAAAATTNANKSSSGGGNSGSNAAKSDGGGRGNTGAGNTGGGQPQGTGMSRFEELVNLFETHSSTYSAPDATLRRRPLAQGGRSASALSSNSNNSSNSYYKSARNDPFRPEQQPQQPQQQQRGGYDYFGMTSPLGAAAEPMSPGLTKPTTQSSSSSDKNHNHMKKNGRNLSSTGRGYEDEMTRIIEAAYKAEEKGQHTGSGAPARVSSFSKKAPAATGADGGASKKGGSYTVGKPMRQPGLGDYVDDIAAIIHSQATPQQPQPPSKTATQRIPSASAPPGGGNNKGRGSPGISGLATGAAKYAKLAVFKKSPSSTVGSSHGAPSERSELDTMYDYDILATNSPLQPEHSYSTRTPLEYDIGGARPFTRSTPSTLLTSVLKAEAEKKKETASPTPLPPPRGAAAAADAKTHTRAHSAAGGGGPLDYSLSANANTTGATAAARHQSEPAPLFKRATRGNGTPGSLNGSAGERTWRSATSATTTGTSSSPPMASPFPAGPAGAAQRTSTTPPQPLRVNVPHGTAVSPTSVTPPGRGTDDATNVTPSGRLQRPRRPSLQQNGGGLPYLPTSPPRTDAVTMPRLSNGHAPTDSAARKTTDATQPSSSSKKVTTLPAIAVRRTTPSPSSLSWERAQKWSGAANGTAAASSLLPPPKSRGIIERRPVYAKGADPMARKRYKRRRSLPNGKRRADWTPPVTNYQTCLSALPVEDDEDEDEEDEEEEEYPLLPSYIGAPRKTPPSASAPPKRTESPQSLATFGSPRKLSPGDRSLVIDEVEMLRLEKVAARGSGSMSLSGGSPNVSSTHRRTLTPTQDSVMGRRSPDGGRPRPSSRNSDSLSSVNIENGSFTFMQVGRKVQAQQGSSASASPLLPGQSTSTADSYNNRTGGGGSAGAAAVAAGAAGAASERVSFAPDTVFFVESYDDDTAGEDEEDMEVYVDA